MSSECRQRIYAGLACFLFLAAIGLAIAKAMATGQRFDLPVSDGRFYFVYLPSLFVDRDFDFSNQIGEHWGPDFHPDLLADRTAKGLVRNKYPIGVALTLAPAYALGYGATVALAIEPRANRTDGYGWPCQLACLGLIDFLVFRTLCLIDRIAIGRFDVKPQAALLGCATWALGTHYLYYALREPFMAHAISAYWCAEFAATIASIADRTRTPRGFWLRFGLCGAMAVICRPTNAHLAPLGLFGVCSAAKAWGWKRLLCAAPFALASCLPFALQAATWNALFGSWLYFSYTGEGFLWTEPKLWQTLFSGRHGLFFWTPILVPATLVVFARWKDGFIAASLVGAGLLWYANAAWQTWWFGDAFGGRAYLELAWLFGLGLAMLFDRFDRRTSWILVASAIVWNVGLMLLYVMHKIPRDGSLLAW